MKDRTKIYPTPEQLKNLGFSKKGSGDDPRDFWYELDLSNDLSNPNKLKLELDAYFDFSLNFSDEELIPISFQNIQEIELFISIFKRPSNHAFSQIIDICSKKII